MAEMHELMEQARSCLAKFLENGSSDSDKNNKGDPLNGNREGQGPANVNKENQRPHNNNSNVSLHGNREDQGLFNENKENQRPHNENKKNHVPQNESNENQRPCIEESKNQQYPNLYRDKLKSKLIQGWTEVKKEKKTIQHFGSAKRSLI